MAVRPPNENPYHHPYVKPLAVDLEEVERIARDCFEIVLASRSVGAFWNGDLEEFGEKSDWSFPSLMAAHLGTAEERLSTSLAKLAVLFRALDDQLATDDDYNECKARLESELSPFLTAYSGEGIPTTLRESCNKIIHCEDFRPVYDNGSEPRDEGVYYMTGEIELEGRKGTKNWLVSVDLFNLLEGVMDTICFLKAKG